MKVGRKHHWCVYNMKWGYCGKDRMSWRSQLNLQDESWTFFRTAYRYHLEQSVDSQDTEHTGKQHFGTVKHNDDV